MNKHSMALSLALLLAALPWPDLSVAQSSTGAGSRLASTQLQGTTLEGVPFDLAAQRGKVVLVVFWSTACAVCRDKMPELRANAEGWRDQPFELVLVNTDPKLEDLQAYERILELTLPPRHRLPLLWVGQPGYADSFGPQVMLPVTYLIGKDGDVRKTYTGRVPPEAWDDIADLL